jgi:hypothetical protein
MAAQGTRQRPPAAERQGMGAARAAGAWLASGRLLLLCFDKSSFDWARAGILAGPFGSAAPTARLAFRPRPIVASGKQPVSRKRSAGTVA